jgi:glycosyltransferase involved in cell wall biosynthesis
MIWQLVDSSGIGGIESHITNLTRALNAAGHITKIILLKRHNNNQWFEQLDSAELDWQALEGGFINLIKAIKSQRPNLIHTHGYKAGILGRIAAKICNIPVFSTFHAGERGAFPVSLYQTIDEWSSFLGERIAVNNIIADKMPFKTQAIRNFILIKPHDTTTQKPLVVGFVGRLSHEKGPDIFCKIAKSTNPSIPFHVFGDGPMREQLEAQHKERVTFHGVATNMSQVWPQIGLLLMPSRAEGLPMAALEALSHGIPILASNVGALPQIIKPNITGWLHNYDDLIAFASSVKAWANLAPQTRSQISQNCIKHVTQHFGADEPLSQILQAYKKVGL